MKRILLLVLVTALKIAIMLANNVHSSFLCICKIIADIFHFPVTHLLSESSLDDSKRMLPNGIFKLSISTQTEDESNEQANAMEKSGTDVIIYNLNPTQKLVISQGTFKSTHCGNCKCENKPSVEKSDAFAQTVDNEDCNMSYMSVESDVLGLNVKNSCSRSITSSKENALSEYTSEEFSCLIADARSSYDETLNAKYKHNNAPEESVNLCNPTSGAYDGFRSSAHHDDFELLKGNVPSYTYVKYDGTLHSQKTSSPLKTPQASYRHLSVYDGHLSKTTTIKGSAKGANSDFYKRETLSRNSKRRLSLPVKLNTTNISVSNIKLAQQKLIEETLKNTQRHEKSFNEIKYPFSSDISIDSKPTDGMEDKEVFSCSSYESLPVSDHIRNAFDNNTLLNLYSENLQSEEADFLYEDNLVEAFNDIKFALSEEYLAQSGIKLSIDPKPEEITESDNKRLDNFKNLKQNFLRESSSKNKVFVEHPKLRNNFKKRMISSFTSEVNSSTSMKDMCDVLDEIFTNEVNIISEKFSRSCDEEMLKNSASESNVNSGNNMKDNETSDSSTKRNDLSDLDTANEDVLKRHAISPVVLDHFAGVSSIIADEEINESDYNTLHNFCQKAYNQIVFIDESPSCETSQRNQKNNSEENSLDSFLDEYENPILCKQNVSNHDDVLFPVHSPSHTDKNQSAGPLNQYIEDCSNNTSMEERKPARHRKRTKRNKRKKTHAREAQTVLEKNESTFGNLPVSQKSPPATPNAKEKSPSGKSETCKEKALEKNYQEHPSLKEDEDLKLFEENTSGDSASDNSMVTVKDLSVAEGNNQEC